MKKLILFSLILIAFSCSEEPQTKLTSLPKNAKIVSQAEFDATAGNVTNPPSCFTDHDVKYCCYQAGGVICIPQ